MCFGTAISQDDTAALPEYSDEGADSCFACHDDQLTLAIFRTPHAVPSDPRGPFGHGQLQCESCHGPSGDHSGRVRRGQERPPSIDFGMHAATPVAEQNGMCLTCHEADQGLAWHASGHDTDEVSCADCHTSHAARDPVMATATQPGVCFDCHQRERSQAMKAYAHPFRQGEWTAAAAIPATASRRPGCLPARRQTPAALTAMPKNAALICGNTPRSRKTAAAATIRMARTIPAWFRCADR